jgi:hypothetical protein
VLLSFEKTIESSNLLLSIGNDAVLLNDQLVAPCDELISLFKKAGTALNRSFGFIEKKFVLFDDFWRFFDKDFVFLMKEKFSSCNL